jgi:single-stranded-DNA-specific exonuclease
MQIKNLEKVAKRIKKAIKNKEKIILYGDADLDGATSVIILGETIKNLGGEVSAIYFPDREIEGYGIGPTALDYLKKLTPALLISLDCGIGNIKEVDLANKMGFKVLIIDHHEVLDKLPKAEIVVDPKQKGDRSFKGLANVGIVFKLSVVLLKKAMTENLRKNFLELTALATIADMMPKEDENEIFISEGLRYLEDSWRPGIRAFFETSAVESLPTFMQKVQKIIHVLNARDVSNRLPASFLVLTNNSLEDTKDLIKKLLEKNEERKQKLNDLLEKTEKILLAQESSIIFEGGVDWDYTLLGPLASIICQKYKKPTFVYKKLKDESQGTVRTPHEIDSVALMKKCKKLLITYGGHSMASGFRLKNENLEKFKECLIKNYKEKKQ